MERCRGIVITLDLREKASTVEGRSERLPCSCGAVDGKGRLQLYAAFADVAV